MEAAEPRLGPGWPSVPRGPVARGALRVRVEGFVPYRGVDLTARTTIGSHTGDTLTVHGSGVEKGHFLLEPTPHGWRVVAARGPVQVGDHDVVRGGSWIPDLTRETRLVAGTIVFRLSTGTSAARSTSAGTGNVRPLPEGRPAAGALRIQVVGLDPPQGRDVVGRTRVGSGATDHVRLPFPRVVRRHMLVKPTSHGWRIEAYEGPISVAGRQLQPGEGYLPNLSAPATVQLGSMLLLLSTRSTSAESRQPPLTGSTPADTWQPTNSEPACPRRACRSTDTRPISPYRGRCGTCGETFPFSYRSVSPPAAARRMDDRAAVPDASNADDSGGCFGCFMFVAAFFTLAAMAGGC